ncbi:hypothetical protein MMC25_007129 [Agyrium rufum]|nr:hypothetical protein [Agyrium rufum]
MKLQTALFAASLSSISRAQSSSYFIAPPPAGPDADFTKNPVYELFSTQNISWSTDLAFYSISLWQQILDLNAAKLGGPIYDVVGAEGGVTFTPWTVALQNLSLDDSNVFYLKLLDTTGANTPVTSHYFNVTNENATTTSSSLPITATIPIPIPVSSADSPRSSQSTVVPSSSSSSATSTVISTPTPQPINNHDRSIALGVGLGVGLALLTLAASVAILTYRHRKRRADPPTDTVQKHRPPPPPPFDDGDNIYPTYRDTFPPQDQELRDVKKDDHGMQRSSVGTTVFSGAELDATRRPSPVELAVLPVELDGT